MEFLGTTTAANAGVVATEETAPQNPLSDPPRASEPNLGDDKAELSGVYFSLTLAEGAGFKLNARTGQLMIYSEQVNLNAATYVRVWLTMKDNSKGDHKPIWDQTLEGGKTIQLPGDWSKLEKMGAPTGTNSLNTCVNVGWLDSWYPLENEPLQQNLWVSLGSGRPPRLW